MMMDETYKTFLVSYRHEGEQWNLKLPARDLSDARARLSRLAFAQVDGEIVMSVPAAIGPLAVVVAAVRNALYRLLSRH